MCAAIQSIPEEATKRGVFPEDALRERFLKVITVLPTFFRIRLLSRILPPRERRASRSPVVSFDEQTNVAILHLVHFGAIYYAVLQFDYSQVHVKFQLNSIKFARRNKFYHTLSFPEVLLFICKFFIGSLLCKYQFLKNSFAHCYQVENVARRLAMVPESGAALPVYLLSYLQSFLIIKSAISIPKRELEDEPIDVDSLNTYDILQRAR